MVYLYSVSLLKGIEFCFLFVVLVIVLNVVIFFNLYSCLQFHWILKSDSYWNIFFACTVLEFLFLHYIKITFCFLSVMVVKFPYLLYDSFWDHDSSQSLVISERYYSLFLESNLARYSNNDWQLFHFRVYKH